MPSSSSTIENLDERVAAFADLVKFALLCNEDFGVMAWFRGHANKAWKLNPTIYRDRRLVQDLGYEAALLNAFITGAPMRHKDCPELADRISWLILAGHYGLPTRLLDWTQSILTAVYFAVSHEADHGKDDDAVIWALNPCALNKKNAGRDFIILSKSMEVKLCAQNTVSDKDQHTKDGRRTLAITPVESDARIQAQQSCFTIHGVANALEEVNREGEHILRKHVISAGAKKQLRFVLPVLGIRRSILFPDLQHLAEDIPAFTHAKSDPT